MQKVLCLLFLLIAPSLWAQNDCSSPHVISSLPFSANGLTTCGKTNFLKKSCNNSNYSKGEDYIFRYTPSTDECVNIVTSGTLNYTALFVTEGCSASGASTCIDKHTSSTGNPFLNGVALQANKTYYIAIDTWPSPSCTPFNISISKCPVGSTCSVPITIPSVPFTETGSTCGAGADYGPNSPTSYGSCGPTRNFNGEDIVYTYTAANNECISVSVTGWTNPGQGAFMVSSSCPTNSNSGCLGVSEGLGTTGPAPISNIQLFKGAKIFITIDSDNLSANCNAYTINVSSCPSSVPSCINSPPASDFCATATPICDFSGYCGSTSSSYTADTPSNLNNVFCGTIENNGWLKFVAGSTTANFNVYFGNCKNGKGIQALVLEATNCSNFIVKSNCYEPITASGSGVISATNLTVGNTYLIMIDGYAGDNCDYVFQASQGVLLPVEAGPDVTICQGASTTLTASNGSGTYVWTPGNLSTKSITVSPTSTSDYVVTSQSGNIGCPSPNSDTVRVTVSGNISVSPSNINQGNACSGACDATATIQISGGTVPYSVLWSNGNTNTTATGLCPDSSYTAVVTDNVGCQGSTSVTIGPAVVADFNFVAAACGALSTTGSTVSSAGSGVFSYTGPGTLSISNTGGNNYSFAATQYGSYNVTWTVTTASCNTQITKTLVFREQPTVSLSIGAVNCGSLSASLVATTTAGTGSFTYTGPGTLSISKTGGNNYLASASISGTYSVSYTVDNAGCSASNTKSISFTSQPTASFTANNPTCNTLSTTLNVSPSVGTLTWSYTTSESGTLSFTDQGGGTWQVSASTFGTYQVKQKLVNGSCADSTEQSISFYQQANSMAGPDQSVCALSSTLVGNAGPGTGVWTQFSGPGTSNFTNTNSPNSGVSVSALGSYQFVWTLSNGNCPASSDTVSIIFSSGPSGNAGPDQDICGLSTSLSGSVSNGTGTWSGSGIGNVNQLNSGISVSTYGTYTYVLNITAGSCQVFRDTVEIRFYENPSANAGPDKSICGLSGSLGALNGVGSGLWTPPAGISLGNASSATSAITASGPGTYLLQWTRSNGNCPNSIDTVFISFIQAPNPDAGVDVEVCGLTAALQAANSPFTGSWSGQGNILDPSARSTSVTSSVYGSFYYKWTEFSQAPCPLVADSLLVKFVERPLAQAGNDLMICGNSTNLQAQPSVGVGTWTSPSALSFGSVNSPNSSVSSASFGLFTVVWTEDNGAACPVSADTLLLQLVNPAGPQAGADQQVCGLSTTLAAVPGFSEGVWSYSGPGILSFNNVNSATSSISASKYGLYTLVWKEVGSPCALNSDTVQIHFYESPSADAGPAADKVCALSYTLGANTGPGTGTWTWTNDDAGSGSISFSGSTNNPSVAINASTAGAYKLKWTVVNGNCPVKTDSIRLQFFVAPTPEAGPDIVVCNTLQAPLSGSSSVSGILDWTAESGSGISFTPNNNIPNPNAQAPALGSYTVYLREFIDSVCPTGIDSAQVRYLDNPIADAGSDAVTCGQNYGLNAAPLSQGIGVWKVKSISEAGYSIQFDDSSQYNTLARLNNNPPGTGVTVVFKWVVSNEVCLPDSDEVQVTFNQVPSMSDAGPDQPLCGLLSTTLGANDNGGLGKWKVSSKPAGSNPVFSDLNAENSSFSSDKYGLYVLSRSVFAAGCTDSLVDAVKIDFRKSPAAQAGPDDTLCGTQYTLQAGALSDRIKGKWTLASSPAGGVLSFVNDSLPNTKVSLANGIYGSYTLQYTESNVGCSSSADQVVLVFQEQPIANASGINRVCLNDYDFNANPSTSVSSLPTYNGFWSLASGPGTASFTPADGASPTAHVTTSAFGKYFFVWTETNGRCPASRDTVDVFFVNPNNPDAGLDRDICGLKDTLAANPSYEIGYWLSGTSNPGAAVFVNPADPNSIVNVDAYGTYLFRWFEEISPCPANEDTVYISFLAPPSAKACPDNDTCGLVYSLTASASISGQKWAGIWEGPPGAVFSAPNAPNTTVDVSALPYGLKTFVWKESNGLACPISTDTVLIDFVATPAANIMNLPAYVCGDSLAITGNSGSTVAYWSSIPDTLAFSQPGSTSSMVYSPYYGDFKLTWTLKNNGVYGIGCASTDTANLRFIEQPNNVLGLDTAVCGLAIDLFSASTVSGSVISWQILTGPGSGNFSPLNGNTTQLAVGSYGEYLVVAQEEVEGLCRWSDTIKVNFVEAPIARGGLDDSTCTNTYMLNAQVSVGNGIWSALQPGVSFSPNPGSAQNQVLVSTPGSYGFVWTENNGISCPLSRDTVYIEFLQTPQPDAGVDQSFCGPNFQLNAQSSPFMGAWTYLGSSPISLSNSNQNNTDGLLNSNLNADFGLHHFVWTEQNLLCLNRDTVAINIVKAPTANAGPDSVVCGLDFGLLALPSVGSGTWVFAGPDSVLFSLTQSNNSADGRLNYYGIYPFVWTETNSTVCPPSADTTWYTFEQAPISDAGSDSSFCGLIGSLSAGLPHFGSYLWQLESGPGTANISAPSAQTSTVNVATYGSYTFRLIGFNGLYCDPDTDRVVLSFFPPATADAGPDQIICDSLVQLSASGNFNSGYWLFAGDGNTPHQFVDSTAANTSLSISTPGIHALLWYGKLNDVCPYESDTVLIETKNQPKANGGPRVYEYCGLVGTVQAIPSAGVGQWRFLSGPDSLTINQPFSDNTLIVAPLDSFGTYFLTWTEDNGAPCLVSVDTLQLIFYEQPQANAGDEIEACGLSVNLAAISSVGVGTWELLASSGMSASFDDSSKPDALVTASDYGDYVFRWTENNGNGVCPLDQDAVFVSFKEAPQANAGPDISVCGNSLNMMAEYSTGLGYFTLKNPLDPLTFADTNNRNSSVSTTQYGQFELYWHEENGKVCPVSVDSVMIEFVELPVPNAGPDQVICGLQAPLAAVPSVGSGSWSGPPGSVFTPSNTVANPGVQVSQSGTYSFTWTEFNQSPCPPVGDQVQIQFVPIPTGSLSLDRPEICRGESAILSFNLSGQGPFTVSYQANNGSITQLNNIVDGHQVSVSPDSSTTYRLLSIVDGSAAACNSLSQSVLTLTVNQLPEIVWSGLYNACEGSPAVVNYSLSGQAPFVVQFSDGSTANLSNAGIQSSSFNPVQSIDISVISISDAKCSAPGPATKVRIERRPIPTFTLAALMGKPCEGDSVYVPLSIPVGQAPFAVYYKVDGVPNSFGTNRTDTLLPFVWASGVHNISIDSLIDQFGCKSQAAANNYTVYTKPSTQINLPDTICRNNNATFNFVNNPSASGPFNISYRVDQDPQARNFIGLGNLDSRSLLPFNNTTYHFDSITDTKTSCVSAIGISKSLVVLPLPKVSMKALKGEYCEGQLIELALSFEGIAPFEIELNNGLVFSGLNTTDTLRILAQSSITYTITRLKDSSGRNCPQTISGPVMVVVNPLPKVDFEVENLTGCAPLVPSFVNLTPTADLDPNACIWLFGDGNNSTQCNTSHIYSNNGAYIVRLQVSSNKGCLASEQKTVIYNLNPDPLAQFSYSPKELDVINNEVRFVNQSTGARSYEWDFGDSSRSRLSSPSHKFNFRESGTYLSCLTAISDSFCVDTACVLLSLSNTTSIFVPNAFTPDGDGINDVFYPSAEGIEFNSYRLLIFNRWGELIFESRDKTRGWDGTYQTGECKTDVYTWKLLYTEAGKSESKTLYGQVQLLR